MEHDAVIEKLRSDMGVLRERYHVARIALFGSAARGRETEASDIDLLVAFERPVGLFHFVDLRDHLESLLGRPVDLVTEDAVRPEWRDRIRREAIFAA